MMSKPELVVVFVVKYVHATIMHAALRVPARLLHGALPVMMGAFVAYGPGCFVTDCVQLALAIRGVRRSNGLVLNMRKTRCSWHSRSWCVPPSFVMNCVLGYVFGQRHTVWSVHSRSEVAVAAFVSHWLALHTSVFLHDVLPGSSW